MMSSDDLQDKVTIAESIAREIGQKFNVEGITVTQNENWDHNSNEIFIAMPNAEVYESEQYQEYIAVKSGWLLEEHPEISWYFNNSSEPAIIKI